MKSKEARRYGLIASPKAMMAIGAAVASVIAGISLSSRAPAGPEQAKVASIGDLVNDTMGLAKSSIVNLELDTTPGRSSLVQVPIDGQIVTLDLTPHNSTRSDEYKVSVQIEDGSLVEVQAEPSRTVRGRVLELPGSLVAGSMLEEGLYASIVLRDGEKYWIEPIARHVDAALPQQHVLYRSEDALCDGLCGVNNMKQAADQLRNFQEPTPIGSDICKIAQIAIDADYHFYQDMGSSVSAVENQVNSVMEALNALYEDQVGIRHVITELIIRTSSAANPYTTNNADSLLNQFRSHWNSNHNNVTRDVAHLFTGRNLSGSTIGIAWLGVICSGNSGYGLSQRITPFSCQTDLTSHEIGHNWNAPHCSCPSFTMNPSLTCANDFAASSIASIVNHRNSRWCLSNCPPPGPANNTCSGTIVVGLGDTPFDNVGATTDGPAESGCEIPGDNQVQADVYFGHIVQCTGNLTISVCDSDFNTKLAVYDFPCPTEAGTAIACDVNSCDSNRSQVTIPVTQGQALRIRVGGQYGAQGQGVLSITCEPTAPACPGDFNDDAVVDVSDLLSLLSAWGACDGCVEDLDGNDVVDVSDLLSLLSAWGDC